MTRQILSDNILRELSTRNNFKYEDSQKRSLKIRKEAFLMNRRLHAQRKLLNTKDDGHIVFSDLFEEFLPTRILYYIFCISKAKH